MTNKNLKVAVMGHTCHGKTTLINALNKLMMHLSIKNIKLEEITPACTKKFDCAVLVVSATDGVMPQTVECVKLAHRKN